jgi:N-sulfoglucosamine sulfohydrolase
MDSFTRTACVALLAGVLVVPSALAAQGRSVLLLISDDQGMGDAGCYGHRLLKTPNIDRLASQGVRFTHAFATTASCSASRSVIYTGLHNHFNGQYGHAHAEHHFVQRPHVETVFMMLKAAGYQTGLIGKKHVLPDEKYSTDFEPAVNARDVTRMAELAGEFFRSAGDKPFFLVVGFADPHRAAKGFGNDGRFRGTKPVVYDPATIPVPYWLPDQPEVRTELAEYYQAISRMDDGIGKVLAQLDSAGKTDQTLVLYTSDNGMPFPGAKTNVYEPGIRLPFIVRSPKHRRGIVNPAMVSFVDIVPTVLDWTGVKGPAKYRLHGRSFLSILDREQPVPVDWDEVYASHTFHEITMYYPMRAVRTRRYKYIWNIAAGLTYPHASDLFASETWQGVLRRGAEMFGSRPVQKYLHRDEFELYDLESDPEELHNLAGDRNHADVKAELAAKLKSFQETTNDPWIVRYKY